MNSSESMRPQASTVESKVPQVTLLFWVVKILATTVGETGGDALSMTLNLGYAISSLIFLAFFVLALAVQVSARRYRPLVYWAVVVATTTVGTTMSDYLDRTLALGYVKSAAMLFGAVLAVLVAWHRSVGRIEFEHITQRKEEIFYWVTILVSNTLGTALGDFVATTTGLGFEKGALVFGGLIAVLAIAYLTVKRIPAGFLFWSAYILTRPLGATLGDTLTKPVEEGGLDLGRITSSLVIAGGMTIGIVWMSRRSSRAPWSSAVGHRTFSGILRRASCATSVRVAKGPSFIEEHMAPLQKEPLPAGCLPRDRASANVAALPLMPPPVVWQQRWHPLREEWVLYTSHRGGRPWIGDTHKPAEVAVPSFDPTCALCPGNKRLKGENPRYTGAFCFTNDLPCFSADAPAPEDGDEFYRTKPATGTAEVICYSPDHAKTFVDLTDAECRAVVDLWAERTVALGARADVDHVLIFENKGSLVGTSNPHPHCQIYAGNLIYGFTAREVESSRKYFQRTGRFLGQDILQREAAGPRVVAQNDAWLACVPWFARYAYEVVVLPKRSIASLADLTPAERGSLGLMVREVATRYDNLWKIPMPYVMAVHQAPADGGDYRFYPLHLEFHPPLRKPDTMKYLAGPEIGGGSMTNESDPDLKAAELRAVSSVHYKKLG